MSRKEEYRKYRETERWAELRTEALDRDGYCCRICNDKASEVHHRRYTDVFGLETVDDLTSLCRHCHHRYHDPIEFQDLKEETYHKASVKGGTTCSICTHHVEIYTRPLHKSMALGLVLIHAYFEKNPDVDSVHVENFMKGVPGLPSSVRGDLAKLRFWGLTENVGPHKSGLYRVTEKGKSFVAKEIKVPRFVVEFKSKVIEFIEPNISIIDALVGPSFDGTFQV